MAELTGLGAEKPLLDKDDKDGQRLVLAEEGEEQVQGDTLSALEQIRRMSPMWTFARVASAVLTTFVHATALRSEHLKDLILTYLCFALLCLWATLHVCSSQRCSMFIRDTPVPFMLLLAGAGVLIGSVVMSNIALASLQVPVVQALRLYALPYLAALAYSTKSERMPWPMAACALSLFVSLLAMVYCDILAQTALHGEKGGGWKDWRIGYIIAAAAVAVSSNFVILLQTFKAVHKSSIVQTTYGILPPAAGALALGSMFFESKIALLALSPREWLLLGATAICAIASGVVTCRPEAESRHVASAVVTQARILLTVSLGWLFATPAMGLNTSLFIVMAVLAASASTSC